MRGVYPTVKALSVLLSLFFFHSVSASELVAQNVTLNTPMSAPATPPPPRGYGPFVMDAKLEPRVKFWVDIYAKYHTWEAVISDVRFPQLVFSVVDTRGKPGAIASEKRKLSAILRQLSWKLPHIQSGTLKRIFLKPLELRVLEAFEKNNLIGELKALADDPRRLRAQTGLRDALEDALFMSGRYLPRMEALFQRFRLPTEIAYLPFVESGFNKKAVSKVGASGIWQFMPYTGKLYLRVDEVVDERNDPMRAAEAAARLMRQNFDILGDWPLAITAYNHGTTGVARAARETGTREISEIIERVKNPNFGFASQNFYACFLAALHVGKNSESYLGTLPRARKLEFDEFVMPDFMLLKDFLASMQIDETLFRELNPALTEEVYSGNKLIPVGYMVRVPVEASVGFLHRYEAIPAHLKFKAQRGAATEQANSKPAPITASVPEPSLKAE